MFSIQHVSSIKYSYYDIDNEVGHHYCAVRSAVCAAAILDVDYLFMVELFLSSRLLRQEG